MNAYPYCLTTTVAEKALEALLENPSRGSYRDDHPWLIAREMVAAASAADQQVPLLVASGDPLEFSYWVLIEAIDVVELHRATWETRIDFGPLKPINPIWTGLDSVLLKPGDDQLRREQLEPIKVHRQALDAHLIHPYAICETPGFLLSDRDGEG
jgi:hypothetical protein